MKTSYIQSKDHTALACFEKYCSGSSIGLVLLHGLAEHKGRYADFIETMYNAGISVFAVDLRGHGESGGARADVDDFSTYMDDLDSVVHHIRQQHPNLRIALLGHSLGGLVAAGYVENHTGIECLILSSPLLVAPRAAFLLKILPYRRLGSVNIRKRHSESREMLAYGYNDPLSCNYFTLRLIGVVFCQGLPAVLKNLGRVSTPVLLMGGAEDPLIDTARFERLLSGFGSTDRELVLYKGVRHRLLQSTCKDKVITKMISWLRYHIQTEPGGGA